MLTIIDKVIQFLLMTIVLMLVPALLIGCDQAVNQSNPNITPAGDDLVGSPLVDPDGAALAITPDNRDRVDDPPVNLDPDQIKRETRALWSWAGRIATSKDDIDALVAELDGARLNVILLGVYRDGSAYFEPSHTRFPDSKERLANQSPFKEDGYPDALSYLLAIRNERRMDDNPLNDFEVHAWVGVHRGGEIGDSWPPEDLTKPYMLNAIFPEFKLKFGDYYRKNDERYVNHRVSVIHQPKFKAYIVDLLAGLVEDYDVDGVHLDFIRTGGICFNNEALDYPGTEYDYPGCQEDYKAWTRETYGHEYTLWDDTDGSRTIRDGGSGRVAAWQERAVGMLVKSIHDEVKAVNPNTIISVASVRNDTSRTNMSQLINGQASWEWLDNGWIDISFVTAYSANTQAVVDKVQAVRDATQKASSISKVFPGLVTFNLDQPHELWSGLIVEQVAAVMNEQGTEQPLQPPSRGVALFRDRKFSPEAIQALGDGPFFEPALPFWGE